MMSSVRSSGCVRSKTLTAPGGLDVDHGCVHKPQGDDDQVVLLIWVCSLNKLA